MIDEIDPELQTEAQNREKLALEFVRPEREFKGMAMRPHGLASEALIAQAMRRIEPPVAAHTYAMIYAYVHLAPLKEAVATIWNGKDTGEKIYQFCENFATEDIENLLTLINEEREVEDLAKVRIEESGGAPVRGNP